jgi:hypothetical protein
MAIRTRDSRVYPVRFLCGDFDRAGTLDRGAIDGPVKSGSYATSVDVRNPDSESSVTFAIRAGLLSPIQAKAAKGRSSSRQPSKPVEVELEPLGGMVMDGAFIRNTLLAAKDGDAMPAPAFLMGWLSIEADADVPLDVVTVYTAHGFVGGAPNGFSMQVISVAASSCKRSKSRKS